MTEARPYRAPVSFASALLELQLGRGRQFEPDTVAAFEATVPRLRRRLRSAGSLRRLQRLLQQSRNALEHEFERVVAEYVGAIETVASFQARILTAQGGEAVVAYVRSLDPDLRRLSGTYYRICLRLNPNEHFELLQAVREVYVFSAPNLDVIKYSEERVERVVNASNAVFRAEWKRVKRGEPTFWITKYVALAVALAAAVAFFGFLTGHVSLQWR